MAEKMDVAQVVAMLTAAYPNFNISEITIDVYYETLKDIPADMLKAAAMQAISEPGRKFAPSVGEIRGAVVEIMRKAEGTPGSYEAWQEVVEQMRMTGHTGKPIFSHPLILRTVRVFGWRELCLSENPVADRARFVEAFEQLSKKETADMAMLPAVKAYIETRAGQDMKLLADTWSKR